MQVSVTARPLLNCATARCVRGVFCGTGQALVYLMRRKTQTPAHGQTGSPEACCACAAICVCRYYLSWRNASLNGTPLSDDAMAHLQMYAIPSSGRLKLDYVSYQASMCWLGT